MDKIFKLCYKVDQIQSTLDTDTSLTRSKRYHNKKEMTQLRARIRGLVDEVHQKIAKFLCENYK